MGFTGRLLFSEEYPELSNFLGAWFPEADLDGMDDAEAVSAYMRTASPKEIEACLSEGQQLLAGLKPVRHDLSSEANRFFENEHAARDWLAEILRQIETKKDNE